MWWDPPAVTGQEPFLPPEFETGSHMIVFEGETDTMAAWQACPPESRKHILGISGSNAFGPKGLPPSVIASLFADAKVVFFVFDNEDPYTNPDGYASVERGKAQIKAALGRKAKFVRLPQGPQDVAEFFMTYDWAAFKVLLEEAMEKRYNFPALDLSGPIPEYDWLVENLLVKGDIAMLVGDGGVGKSWLTMDLAVAMAQGREKWLGMEVAGKRALIIDQENPMVTVRRRLAALGFNPAKNAEELRYLWYAGIRLDQEEMARKLHEDVETFEPELVVVDSLSRAHFKNENSAEEMNPLMNMGVFPIARNLGATVVLIHHVSKEGGSRGSTAIRNAVDLTLEVKNETTSKGAETGWQLILPDKLRNVPPWGAALRVRRESDEETGAVILTTEEETSAF